MNFFRNALLGMVVLLYLLGSCSTEEMNSDEQGTIEKPVQGDGSEADKKPPVTNGDDSGDVSEPFSPNGDGDDPGDVSEPSSPAANSGVPELQINELRTEQEGSTSNSRVEFIEFKMKTAGNLDRVRVCIAGNYKEPLVYEFSPVEVAKGEYVVLHLRTLDDSSKDEYGDSRNESGGRDSSPTVRDFWVPGNEEFLRKTDAVYVLDKDDNVLDAVMITDKPSLTSWPTLYQQDCFTQAAEFLFNKGAWKSADGTLPGPADAADITNIGSSITRSISRDETVEDTDTSADWYVTVNNGATPGTENNPTRF